VTIHRDLESSMINHPLFVRRKPEPGKEKKVVLGSCVRRLASSSVCVSLLLVCATATAEDPSVPTQIVDLANKVDGVRPGFRAFHAKGVVVEGSFKASPEAARLSRRNAVQRQLNSGDRALL
jgi:hypothetical protein